MTAPAMPAWCQHGWRPGPADEPALTVIIWGIPGTAGSKSAFPIYRKGADGQREFTGRVVVAQDDKSGRNKTWRASVLEAGQVAVTAGDGIHVRPGYPLDEALIFDLVFTVPKPASAPKTRVTWPVSRPDLLKMCRAVEDELKSAAVIKDDARIVDYSRLSKVYPREDVDSLDAPGAIVRIWRKADVFGTRGNGFVANPGHPSPEEIARVMGPTPLF